MHNRVMARSPKKDRNTDRQEKNYYQNKTDNHRIFSDLTFNFNWTELAKPLSNEDRYSLWLVRQTSVLNSHFS